MANDQTAQDIHGSEERYKVLLNLIPDLIFRMTRDGEFIEFVSGADESLAPPPEDFLNKNVRDIFSPELADLIVQSIETALESGSMVDLEYELSIPFDSDNIREFEARMVQSSGNEVLAIVRDVTERNRTTKTLLFQQQENARLDLMNQVALALSHHVRNAISPILIYAEQFSVDDPATAERLQAAALHEGAKISGIVSAIDAMATTGEMPTTDTWGMGSPDMLDLEPLIQRYLEARQSWSGNTGQ